MQHTLLRNSEFLRVTTYVLVSLCFLRYLSIRNKNTDDL